MLFRSVAGRAQDLAAFFTSPREAQSWLSEWERLRAPNGLELMRGHNPVIIARNHRVEEALAAAKSGLAVAVWDIVEASAAATVAEIAASGGEALAVHVDVADAGAVAQIVSVKEGAMPSARDHGFVRITREKGPYVHGQGLRKLAQKLQGRIDAHLLDLRKHAFRTADAVGKFLERQFTKLTPAPQGVTDRLM